MYVRMCVFTKIYREFFIIILTVHHIYFHIFHKIYMDVNFFHSPRGHVPAEYKHRVVVVVVVCSTTLESLQTRF